MTATTHMRRCRDCKTISQHLSDTMPGVLCPKCGSQDTRRIRDDYECVHRLVLGALAEDPMSLDDGAKMYATADMRMKRLCESHDRLRIVLDLAEGMVVEAENKLTQESHQTTADFVEPVSD